MNDLIKTIEGILFPFNGLHPMSRYSDGKPVEIKPAPEPVEEEISRATANQKVGNN
jgi:hypothetical protein